MEATFIYRYLKSTADNHLFIAAKDQLVMTIARGFFPHDYVPKTLEGKMYWEDPKISAEDRKIKPQSKTRLARKRRRGQNE